MKNSILIRTQMTTPVSEDSAKTGGKDVNLEEIRLRELSPIAVRLEELREHFPEAFPEGGFDPSKLLSLLRGDGAEGTQPRRFGLEWPGKAEAIHLLRIPSFGSLRPRREVSLNFDLADHVFITGENLE